MKKRILSMFLALTMCLSLPPMPVFADGGGEKDVEINETNFPDENFRNCVKKFDKDNNNVLSNEEIVTVTNLDCNNKNIVSLKGVEFFKKLTYLFCASNQLTTLDLSENTALTYLSCNYNQLTTLNLSNNTALKYLYCTGNQLTTLDLSENTALKELSCASNQLTTLNMSENTALKELLCNSNQLTTLDLSKNTALTNLSCSANQLTTLDVGASTALTNLSCSANQLKALDLSTNTALKELSCAGNKLTTLNVSANTALEDLYCTNNELTTLNVSANTELKKLSCAGNELTTLDVSANTALTNLSCDSNELTTLNVSTNTALKDLSCKFNQLMTLDVSANTALTSLSCDYNKLTTLNVSANTALTYLSCTANRYPIVVGPNRQFDLSTLPGGFDANKARNWNGGTVSGTTLTADADAAEVTYTYDCGNNKTEVFLLTVVIGSYAVTFDTDGGSKVAAQTVVSGERAKKPVDAPTKDGYIFGGWYLGEDIYDFNAPVTMNIVLKAHWTVSSGGDSSSSGGSSSSSDSTTTKTETKSDGTVVETTTDKDGTVTKTETKTETKMDGTKVETKTRIKTKKDGTVTETKTEIKTDKNGVTTGIETIKTTTASGSTGTTTTKTDATGTKTEAEVKVSEKDVTDAKKSSGAVEVPTKIRAEKDGDAAPTVKVELPKNAGKTKIEIPVENVSSGTVAVIVKPDGTEEIVKDSIPTESGIRLTLDGNAMVKVVDYSKDFVDTRNHWAKEAIDFVYARGLVNGISTTRYAPDSTATRAQIWAILARQNDANWKGKKREWVMANGISNGRNPNGIITRAQMITMLWRVAGSPVVKSKHSFTDVPADSYYAQAVAWAVENGITTSVGGGKFRPKASCTRAQIAVFLYRTYPKS